MRESEIVQKRGLKAPPNLALNAALKGRSSTKNKESSEVM